MLDISNAKLELWSVDDFVNVLEQEYERLQSRYKERLAALSSSKNTIKPYLHSIGLLRESKYLAHPGIVIGLVNWDVEASISGVFNNRIPCITYSIDKDIPIFNNNIILTSNSVIFNKLRHKNHTRSMIILCNTEGEIIDTKLYKAAPTSNLGLHISPRNTLNIYVEAWKDKVKLVNTLFEQIYSVFCSRNDITEFGSTFKSLSPLQTNNKSPLEGYHRNFYPFGSGSNIIPDVNISKEVVSSIKPTTRSTKITAIKEAITNHSAALDDAVDIFDYDRYLAIANRMVGMTTHTYKFELDAITDSREVDTIIGTLAQLSGITTTSLSTINYLYKVARANKLHHSANRNTMIEDITGTQKSIYGMVNWANTHYRLDLQYHQIYGAVNAASHKVSIIKADTGLGKSRMAIAAALAKKCKYSLMVTEPGNVKEIVREFKEQLNLSDHIQVIKSAQDIKCRKTFNVISYSTLTKVIKEASLLSIPSPVSVIHSLEQSANITAFGNLTYAHAISYVTNVLIHIGINHEKELLDMISSHNNMLSEAMIRSSTIEYILSHTSNIKSLKKEVIDDIQRLANNPSNDHIKSMVDKLIPVGAEPQPVTVTCNIDWLTSGVDHSSPRNTPIHIGSDHPILITVNVNMLRIIEGIVLSVNVCTDTLASILDLHYGGTYAEKKEYVDAISASIHEFISNSKMQNGLEFSREPNSNRIAITTKPSMQKLIATMANAALTISINKAIARIQFKSHDIKAQVAKNHGTDLPIINTGTAHLLSGLHIGKLLLETTRQLNSVLQLFGIALERHVEHIERLQTRAKYHTKMFSGLLSKRFSMIIWDECQNLKNIRATRSIAAMQIKAKSHLFMSATPIANSMSELLSYLVIGYGPRSLKHMLNIWNRYRGKDIASTIPRKRFGMVVTPKSIVHTIDISNALSDFDRMGFPTSRYQQIVDNNMTRITRKDTHIVQHKAWQFEVKTYRMYSIPTTEHMQLYAAQMEIVAEAASSGKYEDSRAALSVLTNLIKISEIPHTITPDFDGILTNKQLDIINLAKTQLLNGRSIIIFTQFVDTVQILATSLSNIVGNKVFMLGDNLNPDQRFTLIDNFRKQTEASCIVGTVNVLGKGFNLACADVIIMSDIPWSPLLYEQSIGRILRPDQNGNPEIFMVMNKYMIDMYKFETIMSKINMIKKHLDKDRSIQDSDTIKTDYKAFLISMLDRSIRDGVLTAPIDQAGRISEGI